MVISARRDSVSVLRAVAITTPVLWLIEWMTEGELGIGVTLGICTWVSVVLSALTVIARRIDVATSPIWRQLVTLALTAGAASSVVHIAFLLGLRTWGNAPDRSVAETAIRGFFDGDALFGFWALLVELPRRIGAERRLQDERRALHQEAELARIRSALEPHFVLNTLHTIAGLITDEPRKARSLVSTLGDLLRDAMHGSGKERHTVREELQWLRGFARILETRHFGKLSFEWDVDEATHDCVLPVLLLQPLLENAVQHGALRRNRPGAVVLRIRGEGDHLVCSVQDDGPGFDASRSERRGRGLELVRRRLLLEAADGSVRVASQRGSTRVELSLPRRTE
ncbi:MAG: histidine kinase [Polyangiaceae bacterium]|nr:histidine kinase [Polyangiaceae bacterium]